MLKLFWAIFILSLSYQVDPFKNFIETFQKDFFFVKLSI